MRTIFSTVALLLALPALLAAQVVNNPRAVSFTASTDHAASDGYTLEFLNAAGAVVGASVDLLKPVPAATTNLITTTINAQPLPFGNGYTVRIRTRAGTAISDWAVSLNSFNRIPGPPGRATFAADVTAQAVVVPPELAGLRLRSDSPYLHAGVNGSTPGVDIDALAAALCGAESGDTRGCPTLASR